jgi:type I restriction enzyme S subunit
MSNWQTKKLDEITFFQEGPGIRKHEYKNNGYPIINVRCVQDGFIDLSKAQAVDPKFIKEKWEHFQVKENDILFTTSGSIGRTAMVTKKNLPLLMNTSVVRFKSLDEKELDKYFLAWLLRSPNFIDEVKSYSSGTAQKNVGPTHLKMISISFPSIPEQHRIVKILDNVFENIEKAKENAEKNLKNSKEIFESYLQSIFANPKKDWEEKTLKDICEIQSKLVDPRESKFLNLTHVGAGNIKIKTGELIDLKTSVEEKLISGKFLFDNSVVLYSKIRPYLMKVVRPNFSGLCSADIYPLVPIKNKTNKDYLYFLLVSKEFTEYAIKGSGRAGMPKVNRDHLFKYKFYLPSLTEQKVIVKKLDALSAETKKLEAIYKQKLVDLEELKKSVLKKAFSGEL